jgi:predicted secreted protein
MGWASGIAVYFVVWWTVLFAVLPWGIQTDEATGQIGAPMAPMLKKKAIATTVVSSLIWLAIYLTITYTDLLSFRHMAKQMPM